MQHIAEAGVVAGVQAVREEGREGHAAFTEAPGERELIAPGDTEKH